MIEDVRLQNKKDGLKMIFGIVAIGLIFYFISIQQDDYGKSFKGDPYDLIGKFFKVKYDLNDPEQNLIVLEDELESDSITLVKAGFTKTKYYEYDDVKVKYLEKSKWK